MNLKRSIIRQSLILSFIILPAYIINFSFLIVAGRIMEINAFGIFYTSLSIVNILIGPAVILNLFFARRVTLAHIFDGTAGAIREFNFYLKYTIHWGGGASLIILGLMVVASYFIGVESSMLILTIVFTAYSIYIAETTRAAFQGLKRFVSLGIETIIWTAIRFIFGISGILIIKTVWGGLAGIAFAAIVTFFVFSYVLVNSPQITTTTSKKFSKKEGDEGKQQIFLFCLSYGLLILMIYLDNLVAYLGLPRNDLGTYSSACILGKSIILFTNPIVQIFFPVMVEQNTQKGIDPITVLKTFIITLFMSCSLVVAIYLFTNFIGLSILGLKSVDPSLIRIVASSAIPLCLIRILILLQLAKGNNKQPLILVPIILTQAYFIYIFSNDMLQFAWTFMLSCWIAFSGYGLLCVPTRQVRILFQNLFSGKKGAKLF